MKPELQKPVATQKIRVSSKYRGNCHSSYQYDYNNFIHKYFLAPEDKAKLCPSDISVLNILADRLAEFCDDELCDDELCDGSCTTPHVAPSFATIYYKDVKLEKQVDWGVVQRGLSAIEAYDQDCSAELTLEETRAALNLNDWLRNHEKILLARMLAIKQQLQQEMRSDAAFLADYEINLMLDFYLREDDPFFEDELSSCDDWDMETARMCYMECFVASNLTKADVDDPDYFGLGDNQDHNDMRNCNLDNPVYQSKHCWLFHELISHCGVPIKHLIRIGAVWADFQVIHQHTVTIDLSGERIEVNQITVHE